MIGTTNRFDEETSRKWSKDVESRQTKFDKRKSFSLNFRSVFFSSVCQNFLVHSDFGLAHRLQEEECSFDLFSIVFFRMIIFFDFSCRSLRSKSSIKSTDESRSSNGACRRTRRKTRFYFETFENYSSKTEKVTMIFKIVFLNLNEFFVQSEENDSALALKIQNETKRVVVFIFSNSKRIFLRLLFRISFHHKIPVLMNNWLEFYRKKKNFFWQWKVDRRIIRIKWFEFENSARSLINEGLFYLHFKSLVVFRSKW